jgi:hypothetical protein
MNLAIRLRGALPSRLPRFGIAWTPTGIGSVIVVAALSVLAYDPDRDGPGLLRAEPPRWTSVGQASWLDDAGPPRLRGAAPPH